MTSSDIGEAVIIEAAINGATPKWRNAMVPRTPREVAEDGLSCLEAGAAIVHNHNDEPVVGDAPEHDPAPYLEAWMTILAERPDALLYPTMPGGGPHTTFERRYAHIPALAEAGVLRIGLVDPGSVNVGGRGPDGRPADIEATYLNTFRDARKMFDTCAAVRPGAVHLHLRAGLPAGGAGGARGGRAPAGVAGQVLLRQRTHALRSATHTGRDSRRTWTCSRERGCRGRWRCAAAT